MHPFKGLLLTGLTIFYFGAQAQYNKSRKPDNTGSDDKAVHYELVRNEPSNSGLFGLVVNPVIVDGGSLNLNFSGGLELFYTYQSKWRLSAAYRIAYLDNIGGEGQDGEPYGSSGIGRPLNYKKASCLELMVRPTLLSWEKETRYHITLGRAGYRTVAVGRVEGQVLRALTARLGYQSDNRIVESKNGIDFQTSTPEYDFHEGNQVYPLRPDNLRTSSTMLQSGIIVAGIGYTTFRDIKIDLDDEKYTGRREEKAQNEVFLDVLYAQKLELQDMVYYHPLDRTSAMQDHMPQRLDMSATSLNKVGVRLGYQSLNMYNPHFGTKIVIEGGFRPGPGTTNSYVQLTVGLIFGGRIAGEE